MPILEERCSVSPSRTVIAWGGKDGVEVRYMVKMLPLPQHLGGASQQEIPSPD